MEIDDHHDPGFHRYPVERDEPDPDRHTEIISEKVDQVDSPDEGERDGEHDHRGLEGRPECEIKHQKDDDKYDRKHDLDPSLRPDLIFVLPAPGEIIPRRELHLLFKNGFGI